MLHVIYGHAAVKECRVPVLLMM